MGRPTTKQSEVLSDFGYDVPDSFEEASAIIEEIKQNGWERPDGKPKPAKSKRDPDSPATDRQKEILEEYGYETEGVTLGAASEVIGKLKDNGWEPFE